MTAARSEPGTPAVLLDRDGTLMRDVDYCSEPNEIEIFPGVPEALRRLKENGYKLIVITNQSGIGRGYLTEEQYRAVESEVLRQIGVGVIDGSYFCPHLPNEECNCRKPLPAMVLQAERDFDLDLARSFFIGDKPSDLECGRNAEVKTILVRTGYGQDVDASLADFVAADFREAADLILRQTG